MVGIFAMVASSFTPLVIAQTTSPAPAAAPTATPAAVGSGSPDGEWPRSYTTASGAALIVYQPQVASWPDQKHIVLYAAMSYTPKGGKQALGTARVESDTGVALDERLVNFGDLKITESNFPGMPADQVKTVVTEIASTVPLNERVIALDRVLANLDTSTIIPKNIEGVKADPPPIFFSSTPAVLLNIDGDPIWVSIPQNDLRFAANTNWELFEHGPTKTFYLRNGGIWLKASDVKGPWDAADTLPESFQKLPDDENWKETKLNLSNAKVKSNQLPKVFVSLLPAEMILLTGKPSYLLVQGTKQLLWVNNTESDVFRMGQNGPVYFLVAGRWFSAPDFTGPWTFATTSLPPEFKQIPLEHQRSRVLASVPGTREDNEAVLLAQIPQTARVTKTLEAPQVDYFGGTPQFQPIAKTTVQRAANTDKDVLKVGDLYYLCFQGVWFMSKAPTGPWTVTGDVPKQIYEIPLDSPSHNVTYVTVEDDDDDAVVFATAAAYTGVMVAWGCAVWGTGYYYPPYYGFGGYYPYYPTYGFGASYNPWTGAYTRGAVAYGPYGGAGVAQRYNPRTGTYSRGAAAWGPYGARGAASAYNPRTGTVGATRQGSNPYGSWGRTGVARGDNWATTSRYTSNITGNTTRVTRTSNGDVYAGRDGNVYRKQGDSFQKYGDGGWNTVERPTGEQRPQGAAERAPRTADRGWDSNTAGQVTRDSSARAEGAQRTRDAGQVRSNPSPRTGGSYRAGGGFRGGGGRRR